MDCITVCIGQKHDINYCRVDCSLRLKANSCTAKRRCASADLHRHQAPVRCILDRTQCHHRTALHYHTQTGKTMFACHKAWTVTAPRSHELGIMRSARHNCTVMIAHLNFGGPVTTCTPQQNKQSATSSCLHSSYKEQHSSQTTAVHSNTTQHTPITQPTI